MAELELSPFTAAEVAGNDAARSLDFGADSKLLLLDFAASVYTERLEITYGWWMEEGQDPATKADGYWFYIPELTTEIIEALDPKSETKLSDLALVRRPGEAGQVYHFIRVKPPVAEERIWRVFTQSTGTFAQDV